jgi:hypothetical protein
MIIIICFFIFGCKGEEKGIRISEYPAGYDFAFTITDDPDDGWLAEKTAVYDYLNSIGMKTSIGVWISNNHRGSGKLPYYNQGVTLDDPDFLKYIRALKSQGFETFIHTVSGGNDLRAETISGFDTYKKYFGNYPDHWVNHFTNYEDIYWGYKRFNNSAMRYLYRKFKPDEFSGDDPKSPYYWGDYCRKYIKYVRSWATSDINTLKFNPSMPYHDPYKPFVKYWYACSDGADCARFNRLISRENVDRLIQERGTTIIYTHFASGFVDKSGNLNDETKELLKYVTSHKNGWFVPVSGILDRFEAIRFIKIYEGLDRYIVVNTGPKEIPQLEVEVYDKQGVIWNNISYRPQGNIPARLAIGSLPPGQSINIMKISPGMEPYISFQERFRLAFSWLISRFI